MNGLGSSVMPKPFTRWHNTTAVLGSCEMRSCVRTPSTTPSRVAMAASSRKRSISALNGVPSSPLRTVMVTTFVALANLQQAVNCCSSHRLDPDRRHRRTGVSRCVLRHWPMAWSRSASTAAGDRPEPSPWMPISTRLNSKSTSRLRASSKGTPGKQSVEAATNTPFFSLLERANPLLLYACVAYSAG